jgi:hypothetical protein
VQSAADIKHEGSPRNCTFRSSMAHSKLIKNLNLRGHIFGSTILAMVIQVSCVASGAVFLRNPEPKMERRFCLAKLEMQIAHADSPLVGATGNVRIDASINESKVWAQRLRGFLKFRDYLWNVHSGETYPYAIKVNPSFGNQNETIDLVYSINQERLADFLLSLKSTTKYWNSGFMVEIEQEWDVDQACTLKLHNTEWTETKILNGRVILKSQEVNESGSRPLEEVAVPAPRDGPVLFNIAHDKNLNDLRSILNQFKAYKHVYFTGTPQAPLILINEIGETEAVHMDPLAGRNIKMRGKQMLLEFKEYKFVSKKLYSDDSTFAMVVDQEGSEFWTLPFSVWISAALPQVSHSNFAVTYSKNAAEDEEPASISVTTDASITDYDHFASYWSVINRSAVGHTVRYNLKGGGKIEFANNKTYPSWKAPVNSPYLGATALVQTQLPFINETANIVWKKVGKNARATDVAAEITTALQKKFKYDFKAIEVGGHVVDQSTEEILKHDFITCQNYSNVFAAVARSMGIPTRIVAGFFVGVEATGHAWNEIEVAPDVWLPLDSQFVPLKTYKGFYVPLFVEQHDTYDPKVEPKDEMLKKSYKFEVTSSRPIQF